MYTYTTIILHANSPRISGRNSHPVQEDRLPLVFPKYSKKCQMLSESTRTCMKAIRGEINKNFNNLKHPFIGR